MPAVTLSNCEDEPIHVPGAVQPHGALVLCSAADLRVLEVSASVESLCGVAPRQLIGHSVSSLLDSESVARLLEATRGASLRSVNPLRVTTIHGHTFDAVLHRPPVPAHALVIELEAVNALGAHLNGGFDPRLRDAILRLQQAPDRDSLAQLAAEQVRALTGFDRVMVYRFDRDWNGEVVAEAKIAPLDSFLHQHYPASDIPAQARRLYELNWLRLIADTTYVPSPLLGREGAPPLDLSFATLRSVSPIHIEYLRNMGVAASMSVSLIVDGKLTGLIACHHYEGPLAPSFAIRETCEYLGQALSWQTSVLAAAHVASRSRQVQEHEVAIMQSVARESELLDGLATDSLLQLVEATGAVVFLREGSRRLGITPSTAQLDELVEYLATQEDLFVTDRLADHLPSAASWADVAAGVLAVTVSRELREYLIWFRQPHEHTIDWAGNPQHEKLTHGDGVAGRLSPRGSFEVWKEIVSGQSMEWQRWQVDGASNLRRLLLGGIRRRAFELRALNERLLDADRAKNDFIATVSHELRTPLNAIGGWAQILRRGGVDATRVAKGIEVIARNVEHQRQLIEDLLDVSRMSSGKLTLEVENVDLLLAVESSIQSVALAASAKDVRITSVIDSTVVGILGDSLRLRQVVTNLLTNAIKFTPKGGKVHVTLQRQASEVELAVTDTGIGITADFLPHVFDLFRQEDAAMNRRSQGLGLGLAIVKKLVELHGGRVSVESEGKDRGSVFRVRLPVHAVRPSASPSEAGSESSVASADLANLHVLIVEDEPDSRELVQQILEAAGATTTAVADATEALDVLAAGRMTFDVILSDIGLPVIDGIQLMKTMRERSAEQGRNLPSVALTAHTRSIDRTRVLQAGFNAHVAKPVDPDELIAVLTSVVRKP